MEEKGKRRREEKRRDVEKADAEVEAKRSWPISFLLWKRFPLYSSFALTFTLISFARGSELVIDHSQVRLNCSPTLPEIN